MSDDRANQRFLESRLYISYMTYHATGEGMRLCLAVGGSTHRTERLLKTKLDEYFHQGIASSPISSTGEEEAALIAHWIPLVVKDILGQIPPGAGDYYAEFYYNIA
jgi:hypothetical protein